MDILYSEDSESIRQYLSSQEDNRVPETQKVDINHIEYYFGTPLHYACRYNTSDVVDVLIEFGADVNKLSKTFGRDDDQRAPLHVACRKGYIDIVYRLLNAGADPNVLDNYGRTPIMSAVFGGFLDIVKILTPYCNFNHSTKTGVTIFHRAILAEDEIFEYVFDFCTDINHVDIHGRTYLHLAVFEQNHHAIQRLLDKGIDINIEDNEGIKAFEQRIVMN